MDFKIFMVLLLFGCSLIPTHANSSEFDEGLDESESYEFEDQDKERSQSFGFAQSLTFIINSEMENSAEENSTSKEKATNFTDCYDVYLANEKLPGIYQIHPDGKNSISVNCLEGGWTVFQSRGQFGNPSDYFLRKWHEYVNGFGEPGKEQWMGLDNIFSLTNRKNNPMQLKITMESSQGRGTRTATYDNFSLKDQVNYPLNIGKYVGDAGDSLIYHNGSSFSTIDRDNDGSGHNCASNYKSAWWFKSCHYSSLNGLNYGSARPPVSNGIWWDTFCRYQEGKSTVFESLKSTFMAFRPMSAE